MSFASLSIEKLLFLLIVSMLYKWRLFRLYLVMKICSYFMFAFRHFLCAEEFNFHIIQLTYFSYCFILDSFLKCGKGKYSPKCSLSFLIIIISLSTFTSETSGIQLGLWHVVRALQLSLREDPHRRQHSKTRKWFTSSASEIQ